MIWPRRLWWNLRWRWKPALCFWLGNHLFMNWTPPEGFAFLHHWARADGKGGVFVAEAASAAALLEATAPWGPNLDFDIAPLVDITEAVPTFLKVQEWTKSVG